MTCPKVGQGEWLTRFAHRFGGVECTGRTLLSLPNPWLLFWALQKYHLYLFVFVSAVLNFPQLRMHTVIFGPLEFLCILWPEVHLSRYTHCGKGSQVPARLRSSSESVSVFELMSYVHPRPQVLGATIEQRKWRCV